MIQQNLRKFGLVILSLAGIMSAALAQTLTGTIKDKNGEPLIGVTILADSASGKGTVTDFEGKYIMPNLKVGDNIIRYSFLGFATQKVKVTLKAGEVKKIDIILQEEANMLDEVVAVGYGTQRKREITGSVVKIKGDEVTGMPAPSFEAALQGKAAGVQITVGSGLAGSGSIVRIRGIASISAGGDPLYVVDGIPITQDYFLRGNSGGMNNNPLASLNPNDIESIEILKDAAATAIYGSRGANGVIIITTKRGKKGLRVDFGARVGVSLPTAKPNMLNSSQYLQLYQEAWENDGNVGLARLPGGITWNQALNTNTNWVDEVMGVGIKHAYNVGISKGWEKLFTYFNLSYDDNASYLIGNSYQRFSGRFNADYEFSKKLKIQVNSSLSRGQNNRVDAAWAGGLGAAMSTALPIFPIRNPDGTYFTGGSNPVRDRELKDWRTVELRSINGVNFTYKLNDKINLRAQGSYDYMDLTDDLYEPREFINSTHAGIAKHSPVWVNNGNIILTGDYTTKVKEKGNFGLLLGGEYQRSVAGSKRIEVTDVEGPYWKGRGEASNTLEFAAPEQVFAFLSSFARANYSYDNKYYFQLNARVDGSSRFGKETRYGFFPAASAAWVISEEKFLKYNGLISFAKVRTSIGRNGNANLPNYQRFGTYSPPENQIRYNGQPTTYPTRLENPNLRWETSTVFDLGIELGFLNDRINVDLAYYNKNTKDVLMELQVPKSTGFTTYWDNVGQIRNSGVELGVRARIIDRPVFKWNVDFNVARNFNEIVSIGVYSEDAVSGGTNDTRVVVGSPVGTNFLVRFSRIDAETGRPVYYDINGNETYTWDPKDRVPVGSVLPKAIGGFTNNFTYKNWDLNILLIFSYGGNIYESSAKRQLGVVTDWNMRTDLFDRWRQPGDDATFPRLTQQTSTYGSGTPWINTTQWIHDGSYIRLRNISLGYNFNKNLVKKMKLENLRLAFIATNVLTFTRYPGLDPEIARDFDNATDRNMSQNITYLTPPQEKTYSLMLNLTF